MTQGIFLLDPRRVGGPIALTDSYSITYVRGKRSAPHERARAPARRRGKMALDDETRKRIAQTIASDRVVLFMKGTREFPQCGFSARVVQMLDRLVPDYTTVDVLADPAIRQGIKDFSSWPTITQLYVGGELIGGCDIVTEMFQSGELQTLMREKVAQ
jgi:monothiol glutaredoxin